MGPLFILILALQLFYSTTLSKVLHVPLNTINTVSEKLNDYSALLPPEPTNDLNDLSEDEDDFADLVDFDDPYDVPIVQTSEDRTELKFRLPIESVNIDYLRNAVILKFHKQNAKSFVKLAKMENEKKKSVQDNFMRFGKRSLEEYPSVNSLDGSLTNKNHGLERLERSDQTARDARGDNFMRFGRAGNSKNDFMRFGRSVSQDFMRFGRGVGKDFMRLGRTPTKDFMRFGRAPTQDFMRFGRTPSQDFMRFGRAGQDNFMRFGRAGQDNFMRFGRSSHDNFMRFGRNSFKLPKNPNFMRYSRPDNFMRFGRTAPQGSDNFMRFGKSMAEGVSDKNTNASQLPLVNKNELKAAVKLVHEADKNADNENPVDKAIKVLFDKHQQQDAATAHSYEQLSDEETTQHNGNTDLDSDFDYLVKEDA